jgi:pre-mRNA-processing factor 8
MAAATVKEI